MSIKIPSFWDMYQNQNTTFWNWIFQEEYEVLKGRKFGLGLLMATQFLAGMDSESIATVLEAGNVFYFQQGGANIRSITNKINPIKPEVWVEKLNALDIGEAVLCGTYTTNNNKKDKRGSTVVKHGKGGDQEHEIGRKRV